MCSWCRRGHHFAYRCVHNLVSPCGRHHMRFSIVPLEACLHVARAQTRSGDGPGAWTLYLVSQHPEVEAQIVAELTGMGLLATAAQPQPRRLQYEDLSKLSYLNMVIKARMAPTSAAAPCQAGRPDPGLA